MRFTISRPRGRCTMKAQRPLFVLCLVAPMLAGCREPTPPLRAVGPAKIAQASDAPDDDNGPVVTIDHQVPHTSTVPANAGELVHLFVRERVRSDVANGKLRDA